MTIGMIPHEADDKKLRAEIERFNVRLEKHQAAASLVDGVPDLDVDAMMKMDAKALASEAAKRTEGRWKVRQDGVTLARLWLELLEACQPEADATADAAQRAFADLKATTAKTLVDAGLGVESQPAAKANYTIAAERQFNIHLMRSEPVQAADTAARQAVHHAAANRKSVATAKSAVADATDGMKNFYHQALKG
jgi:hypothetical protein